ncbi:MAG: tRNA pseudouridine(55) synthase TruB [Rickettsiales bacterium]|nr:tRNA pseudouridine(55) synthase TruB [Rickettsiales bacterium]
MQPNLKFADLWLNIDKPLGISSARAVAIVKRITGAKKVGHGGTLDPFASGILPIALNKATKTSEALMNTRKKYLFRITWGEFRDTDDVEGKVIETSLARPTNAQIISALPFFIGKIKQTPSRFSAIKINGQRAYDLARKDVVFEMPPRDVEIFSLKFLSNCSEFAELEVECSKGTYIRSLARDISKKIGVYGYVSKLTRLRVGKFLYEKRISLDALKRFNTYGGRFSDGSLLLVQDVKLDDLN